MTTIPALVTDGQLHVKCPACQSPMHATVADGKFLVYCGYGPCPSAVSNDGVSGDSLTEALEALERIRDSGEWEVVVCWQCCGCGYQTDTQGVCPSCAGKGVES
jgi:Zn finger protein HypA/HybF involved in hydrogenase expression